MKKILIYMFFVFTFSFPVHAEVIASGNDCGEHCSWKIENGVLTVTGYGDISDFPRSCKGYCHNTAPWGGNVSQISKIVIENEQGSDGFKTIGNGTFSAMDVSEVVLPDGLKKIGDLAFIASGLRKINLPDSIEQIGSLAFNDNNISELRIPASLKKLESEAFASNPIKTLVIPEGVTEIHPLAFYCDGCSSTLSGRALPLEKIYCSAAQMEQCMAAISRLGDNIQVFEYQNINGDLYVNGRFYSHANDILSGNNIKKRIYSVEEASKLSKNTGNTFKLRYK